MNFSKQADEAEDDEVLVDDFDGQCCRTYPYNHSKIQKWQKEKNERRRLAEKAAEKKIKSDQSKALVQKPDSSTTTTEKLKSGTNLAAKPEPMSLTTTSGKFEKLEIILYVFVSTLIEECMISDRNAKWNQKCLLVT